MSFERLDSRQLLQIVDEQRKRVEHFHNNFTETCLKDLRKGQYRASVLLRDYRIVEIREYIPDFNAEVTLTKLQQFIIAWYSMALSFCVSLPVRAPVGKHRDHLFNNYLVVSCETNFYSKGKVFQVHGGDQIEEITEVDESNPVITATAILNDTAVRPYLHLFHFALAYN